MYKIFLSGPYNHPWRQQFRVKIEQELSDKPIIVIDTDDITYYLQADKLLTYELAELRKCDILVAYIDTSYPVHTFFQLAYARLLAVPNIILSASECWPILSRNALLLESTYALLEVDTYLCPFQPIRENIIDMIELLETCRASN